jgi:hypothetical protein
MMQPVLAAATNNRMPISLTKALHSGPFDAALRLAIAERGLTLESLQRRLRADGLSVSLSALSYWQRGIRRPERAESLRAVRAIERILGLRPASLVALLGPPRPRGRWCGNRATGTLGFEDMWGPHSGLETVLDDLDATVNADLEHVSVQGDRRMGPDRCWDGDYNRRAVAACTDGVDRFIALKLPDRPNQRPPKLDAVTGCRLGRVRTDPASGVHGAELLFDLPLLAGQAHVFEYRYKAPRLRESAVHYVVGSRHPMRELVLRVHFDPRAIPVRCYHVRRDRHDEPFRDVAEAPVPAGGTVNLVSLDAQPGIEGLRWEWE